MAPAAHRRGTHCTRLPQTSGQLQGTCRREGWIGEDRHRCTCQERRQEEWRGVYRDRQKGVDVHVEGGSKENGEGWIYTCIERARNRDDQTGEGEGEEEMKRKINTVVVCATVCSKITFVVSRACLSSWIQDQSYKVIMRFLFFLTP